MLKIRQLLLCVLLVVVSVANAQSKKVSGQVTSESDGESIPGVSILIVGEGGGTITDIDGNYTVSVPNNEATLRFSFIGMESKDITVGNATTLNVQLASGALQMDELVVTAMGISRDKKSLGYAATTLGGEELLKARSTNVTSSLSGKVAGLQVQASSSDPGAASSVIIRGFGSINGSNQPLYVVDGVPIQNSTISSSGHAIGASGISNIASSDIDNMTVLKGAAATALYGSRASNGVILITTKQGVKGNNGRNFSIEYNGGLQLRQISTLPTFQNDYGQGWNGQQTYIENGSWGPAFNGSVQNYGPIYDNKQSIHEYSALEDNVKDFFDLGVSQNHSLSISGTSEDNKMTYYLSASHTDDDGIMPTDADSYKRNTIAYRTSYQAAKWLKVSSSMNFAKSETDIVGSFQGTSVIDGLYEMPRGISIVDMQDLSNDFNTPQAYYTPYGITNPYWSLENNYNHLDSKQVYGKLQADITPTDHITLTYRLGFDYTDYDRKVGYPQIKVDDSNVQESYGYAPSNMNQDGYVFAGYRRSYEMNNDFLANYDNEFGDITLKVTAGVNVNERSATSMSGQTDVLTFETGFWDLSNGATKSTLSESQYKRRLIGVFGDANIGYKDFLFLNLTARNDWSSTLPTDANNYFYPGATLSYIFTETLPDNDILSFGKVRLAYGKTGNDADTYMTSTSYIQAYANGYYDSDIASFPMNSTNAFISSSTAGSTTLQPEMTSELEVGVDLRFMDGLFSVDASYYNRTTEDQIFTLPVDPSTGYSYNVTNFGEVQNKGFELLLNTTPIRKKNLRWDIGINFSKNYNEVLSMPSSLEGGKVTIYDFAAGNDAVYMYAEEGKAMGTYYTYLPQYITDKTSTEYGKLIVDEYGQPILGDEVEDTGLDMNHKWTGGLTSSLYAYGFTLSAALDVRYGGTMFSRTKNLMQFTGNGIETTYNDRNPFIIPNSIEQLSNDDGDITGYQENIHVIKTSDNSYQKYFNEYGAGQGGLAYLVDRSYAKLRNVTISYDLPKSWVSGLYLNHVSVSAFVNNAFTWTAKDNYHVDPESTTTGTDLEGMFGELYSNPSSRIYGFNLNVTF